MERTQLTHQDAPVGVLGEQQPPRANAYGCRASRSVSGPAWSGSTSARVIRPDVSQARWTAQRVCVRMCATTARAAVLGVAGTGSARRDERRPSANPDRSGSRTRYSSATRRLRIRYVVACGSPTLSEISFAVTPWSGDDDLLQHLQRAADGPRLAPGVPPGVIASWTQGTVIRSWLLDLLVRALQEDPTLERITGYAEDSGEGRWTVEQGIENAVPMPTIAASLFARFVSRQEDSPTMKAVAALRNQFGGHAVKAVQTQEAEKPA